MKRLTQSLLAASLLLLTSICNAAFDSGEKVLIYLASKDGAHDAYAIAHVIDEKGGLVQVKVSERKGQNDHALYNQLKPGAEASVPAETVYPYEKGIERFEALSSAAKTMLAAETNEEMRRATGNAQATGKKYGSKPLVMLAELTELNSNYMVALENGSPKLHVHAAEAFAKRYPELFVDSGLIAQLQKEELGYITMMATELLRLAQQGVADLITNSDAAALHAHWNDLAKSQERIVQVLAGDEEARKHIPGIVAKMKDLAVAQTRKEAFAQVPPLENEAHLDEVLAELTRKYQPYEATYGQPIIRSDDRTLLAKRVIDPRHKDQWIAAIVERLTSSTYRGKVEFVEKRPLGNDYNVYRTEQIALVFRRIGEGQYSADMTFGGRTMPYGVLLEGEQVKLQAESGEWIEVSFDGEEAVGKVYNPKGDYIANVVLEMAED